MFELSVSTTFDAAHRLENYSGPCSRLHGHTFTVTGVWGKTALDRVGMTLDLVELKKHLRVVLVDMDHCNLNKVRALPKPTAENIAKLLFERLAKRAGTGKFLKAVIIEETPGCSVRYAPTKILAPLEEEPEPADELAIDADTEQAQNDEDKTQEIIRRSLDQEPE